MTQTQISTCLASISRQENQYLTLEEVSTINMRNNSTFFPDDVHEYYFNSSKQLLLVYKKTGTNTRELESIVDYAMVFGFTFVNAAHNKYPYKYGRTV